MFSQIIEVEKIKAWGKACNIRNKLMRLTMIFILGLVAISSLSGCSKPPDQKAYDEIIATMSMEKAKKFLDDYPQSRYRNRLVNEIIEWSKNEETEIGFRIIMEALPKDHPRFKEVVTDYEKRFGEKMK